MIAFFANTNLKIVNVINIKMNYFPYDDADLYIGYTKRISIDLLKSMQKLDIFNNVFIIDTTHDMDNVDLSKKIHLKSIFGIMQEKKSYDLFFKENNNRKYNKIFVSDQNVPSRYFITNLFPKNNNMVISMYEEGIGSYLNTKKKLCTCESTRLKSKLWHFYLFTRKFIMSHKVIRNTTEIYLYRPLLYIDKNHLNTKEIPVINKNNYICWKLLCDHANDINLSEYQNREIIYFAVNQHLNLDEYQTMSNYISELLTMINPSNFIIKTHSWSYNDSDVVNKMNFNDKIYVDNRSFFYESMITKINLNNKILISKNSSAVISPKIMFDEEPYVIFTYKLYCYEYLKNREKLNFISDNLKRIYSDKTRIYIPKSIHEFKLNILSIIDKLECEQMLKRH